MATGSDEGDTETLPPDDAFAALGNETRLQILRTLGAVDDPLSFSELRDRVGMRDSGQFNYHLNTVTGHFVSKSADGYELRQAGHRVVEAVLSGAVTEAPLMEPTPIDEPCPICGGPTVVAFFEDQVEHYCTECEGQYDPETAMSSYATPDGDRGADPEYGYLGSAQLPPAGFQGRSPDELYRAGTTWLTLEVLAMASGVCPRCSASLSTSVGVCEAHDYTAEYCDECSNRHAVQVVFRCANCFYSRGGAAGLALVTDGHLLTFLLEHGINPLSPSGPAAFTAALLGYDEDLVSLEPLQARFTFDVEGDELSITVDEELNVVDVSR
jgi:DNA-binding transcriptional ArsR family regulator